MTISSTTNTVSYTGNGSTTAFAVPYAFFGTGTTSEVQVVEVVIATGAETVKSNGSDYTVAGGSGTTGTVTAATAPASTVKWVINRATTQTQETDYVENDPFPAESHEEALDRLTAIDQEQQRALDRTAQLPDGYTGSFDPTLPTAITGSTVLAFNAGATAFEIGPTTAAISGAAAEAAAAAVSADAAAASAAAAATTYDNFDDRYLGQKATDPTLDNDGDALLTGALYFNTTNNVMMVYTGSAWVRTTPTSGDQTNIDAVTANATNINTVAGIAANVTTVAGISANTTTVAGISADVTTVAGISADVTAVENIAANVTTVAGIAANVTTVAGVAPNVTTVAGVAANVTTVAGIAANVTTVAGISADVTTAATNVADITNFADVYIGPSASDPTVRVDASPLQAGDLYFNTTVDELRAYSGSQWVAGTVGTIAVQRYSGDGSTVAFTLATAPASENNTQVYVSGVYQQKDTYGVSGVTVTFSAAPPIGTNNIEIVNSSMGPATADTLSQILANGNSTGGTDIALSIGDKVTNFTSTGIDDNATSTAITINSSENVGIGTLAPTSKLHVYGSLPVGGILVEDSSTSQNSPAVVVIGKRSDANGSQAFTGRLALAKNQTNALVGASNTLGTIYFGGNHSDATLANIAYGASISGISTGAFNSASDMPSALAFYTGAAGVALTVVANAGTERMRIESGGVVRPGADNTQTLGSASYRWSTVYAGTGTIDTSDEREKQQIAELDAAELRVAVAIKGLVKKYRYNDAVELKGDDARIHVGVIAQEVVAAFEAEGLDATRYALLCHDTWEAEPEETDDEGNVTKPARDAGERYGIRYNELLAFIIAAL